MNKYLSALDELDEFSKIAAEADDTYMPGYPPMSPITNSFFSYCTFFDLRFGIDKETIGTCLLDLSETLQLDMGTVELIKNLQASRMGTYLHQGFDKNGNIFLLEVYTHKTYRCYSTSMYQGKKGEIYIWQLNHISMYIYLKLLYRT